MSADRLARDRSRDSVMPMKPTRQEPMAIAHRPRAAGRSPLRLESRARIAAALCAVITVGAGCAHTGGEGEACSPTDAPPLGGFTCDVGLVCNTGKTPHECQVPRTQPFGARCGEDDDCQAGLYCDVLGGLVCADVLAPGVACETEASCGPAGVCQFAKDAGRGTCVTAGDAGVEGGIDGNLDGG